MSSILIVYLNQIRIFSEDDYKRNTPSFIQTDHTLNLPINN